MDREDWFIRERKLSSPGVNNARSNGFKRINGFRQGPGLLWRSVCKCDWGTVAVIRRGCDVVDVMSSGFVWRFGSDAFIVSTDVGVTKQQLSRGCRGVSEVSGNQPTFGPPVWPHQQSNI